MASPKSQDQRHPKPYERGTQADILSSVVSSIPITKGQLGGEASGIEDPEELYALAKRLLIQAKQISNVMLNYLDKTATQFRDIDEFSNNPAIMIEAVLQRFSAFKELLTKNAVLQSSSMQALESMGAPLLHPGADTKGWMTIEQVKKHIVAVKGSSSIQKEADGMAGGGTSLTEEAVQEAKAIKIENRKLKIKVDALQKQVELLSSTQRQAVAAAGASNVTQEQAPPSPSIPSPVSPQKPQNVTTSISDHQAMREITRLRTVIEEQEELLSGLRKTLRDICTDKYPILVERDELRRKVQNLEDAQNRLYEEKQALEARCAQIEGQLQRTVERCHSLESTSRDIASTATTSSSSSIRRVSPLAGTSYVKPPTSNEAKDTKRAQEDVRQSSSPSSMVELLVSSPLLEATSSTVFHVGESEDTGRIQERRRRRREGNHHYDQDRGIEEDGGVIRYVLSWVVGDNSSSYIEGQPLTV